ncbi:MAG: hypothetical protein PHV30_10015 [Candidatus Margulisbacteria bacterium]|nr:hypothetical protein [Candidatus Margulisiibacteriota bacterium]
MKKIISLDQNFYQRIEKNQGQTRYVFCFEKIVVKFPVMNFKLAFQSLILRYLILKEMFLNKLTTRGRYSDDLYEDTLRGCFTGILMKGIRANLKEYTTWFNSPNPRLMPTYISLFGLVNIQKRGIVVRTPQNDLIFRLLRIATQDPPDLFGDMHALGLDENWVVDSDGQVKLADYGSETAGKIIKKYGKAIDRFLKILEL